MPIAPCRFKGVLRQGAGGGQRTSVKTGRGGGWVAPGREPFPRCRTRAERVPSVILSIFHHFHRIDLRGLARQTAPMAAFTLAAAL